MRKLLLLLFIFSQFQIHSQNQYGRPFFTGDFNFSLAVNEYFILGVDDGEPLIVPSGMFFRFGFGYEFKRKVAISINAGFDNHWNYATDAFPTYAGLRYNIFERDDEALFTEFRYGKMWRPSANYPDGNYYGFGLGLQLESTSRWRPVLRLDYHRKGILGFENNRIDSISLGVGFIFF